MKSYFLIQFELKATDFSLLKNQVLNTCERSQFNLTLSQALGKPKSQLCLFLLLLSCNHLLSTYCVLALLLGPGYSAEHRGAIPAIGSS